VVRSCHIDARRPLVDIACAGMAVVREARNPSRPIRVGDNNASYTWVRMTTIMMEEIL
jgi:hypothetical protein